MDLFFDYKKVFETVKNKNIILRYFLFLVGIFCLAFTYNAFLLKYDIVIGGFSGLAIIVENLFHFSSIIFIYITSVLLIILSFIFLGKKQSIKNIIGSLMYPLMLSLTMPLAKYLNIEIDNIVLTIIVSGVLWGFGCGLVYKMGFSSGGSDILILIISKYKKIQESKAFLISNSIIILSGGLIFGLVQIMYSIIVLFISSFIIDRILIGISDSKMFLIYSEKIDLVKNYIETELLTNCTIIKAEGGFTKKSEKIIFCVVNTKNYYMFKNGILEIDPNSFIVINDCYEVISRHKKSSISFL